MDYSALSKLINGMSIITSAFEKNRTALIANTLTQVASEPSVFCLSIYNQNFTKELIQKSRKFNASILTTDATLDFIRPFGYKSGRNENKFSKVKFEMGMNGVPIITQNACAYFECECVGEVELNNCTIYFAKITNSVLLNSKAPMSSEYFQKVIEGKIPPSSPAWAARYVK